MLACLLLACSTGAVRQVGSQPLRLEGELAFGGVYLGASALRTLTVTNPNRTARALSLELPPPFSVAGSVAVPAGEAVVLEVHFTPTAEGAFSAEVLIEDTAVPVTGQGLAPLSCPPPDPCSTAAFDPASGRCATSPLAENAPCEAPCVTGGRCVSGVCQGAFAACDDSDPCTDDSCAPALGCLHRAVACAPSADPCQAGVCDRATGCQQVPVADGVHCGPDDCARNAARVCINGQCTTRARPQGELCFQVLAGVAGGPALVDGQGDQARFFSNRVFAADRYGNVTVFDRGHVRRVTAGGVVSTLVRDDGTGQVRDGAGVAGFSRPSAASADPWGTVLFIDGSGACVREVSPLGRVTTLAPGCSLAGVSAATRTLDGRLWVQAGGRVAELFPDGGQGPGFAASLIASGASGELLLSDGAEVYAQRAGAGAPAHLGTLASGTARWWTLTSEGLLYSRPADAGCEHGLARFDGGLSPLLWTQVDPQRPCLEVQPNVSTFTGSMVLNLTASGDGAVYALQRGTHLARVADAGLVTLAGAVDRAGTADGFGADAGLSVTAGFGFTRTVYDSLAVTPDGEVCLSDARGEAVRAYDDRGGLRSVRTTGLYSLTALGSSADGGLWLVGSEWDADGGRCPHALLHLDPATGAVACVARLDSALDAGGLAATLIDDGQAAVDEVDGTTWVVHPYGYLVRFDALHQLDLFVSTPGSPAVDGALPDAGLSRARAPVVLGADDLAFLDGNAIRRYRAGVLSTIAGAAEAGFVDGQGQAARFSWPLGLALSPSGALLVADSDNEAIRAVTLGGQVRTVGRLTDRPSAVAVAPNGDVYVLVRHALLRGR